VHGAKGLEAPCVIVIDGCDVLGPDPRLIPVPLLGGGSLPVWSPGKTHDCGLLAEAREALHERGREEHNRLLYVAMTRAKDRLVIAPFRTSRQDAPEQAWCEMVRRALSATAGALVRTESPFGAADVWRDGSAWPEPAARSAGPSLAALEAPAWLTTAVEAEAEAPARLRPSEALVHRSPGRAVADHAAEARLRGVLIHALLQRLPTLPAERREAAARAYVRARAPRLDAGKGEALVADALAVLRHEALAQLFGPSSRAEVAIAGRVGRAGEERPVSGRIDRLAVLAEEVLVADFKSTAGVPRPAEALPAPHAAQLALYRELLREIYPTRRVRAFLIWTAGPSIQELPEGELERALDLVTAA